MIRHLLRTALTVACLVEAELLTRRARLARRVDELEHRLAAALARIEREAVGVDVDGTTCTDWEHIGAHHRCGACSYNAIRGAEAEELRAGIEAIIDGLDPFVDRDARRPLVALLDRVNARDSLAHVTERDRTVRP